MIKKILIIVGAFGMAISPQAKPQDVGISTAKDPMF